MKLRTILLVSGLLLSLLGNAQGGKKKTLDAPSNELDQKYTPPSNSPFGEGSEQSATIDVKQAVMFEPFWLGRGILGATYERAITPSISGFFGAGIRVADDFIQRNTLDIWDETYSLSSGPLPFPRLLNASTNSGGGGHLQLGLRYYFGETPFDDGGIEIGWRRQTGGLSLDYTNLSDEIGGFTFQSVPRDKNIQYSSSTFYLAYHASATGGTKGNRVGGMTYGIGLKTIEYDSINISEDNTVSWETTYSLERNGDRTKMSPMLVLFFSYRIGYGW